MGDGSRRKWDHEFDERSRSGDEYENECENEQENRGRNVVGGTLSEILTERVHDHLIVDRCRDDAHLAPVDPV